MTPDCAKAVGLIERLFDGEASSEERRQAEAHLDTCADCRAHLEFLASLTERAREIPGREPPEAYWQHLPRKILSRIEEETGPRSWSLFRNLFAPGGFRSTRRAPVVALLASLVVVVAVGVRFLRENPRSRAESESAVTAESRAAVPPLQEGSKPEESSKDRASVPGLAAGPSPASPSSGKPPEGRTPVPPMAKDEKLAVNTAQKTESLEVAEAARSRMEGEDLGTQAPPSASSAFTEGETVTAPAAVPVRRASAAPAELSGRASSGAGANADDCSGFREALSGWTMQEGESEIASDARKNDLRYRLARCSIDRYQRDGGEALRKAALDDGITFLAFENEGRRADEIRTEVERIRLEKNPAPRRR